MDILNDHSGIIQHILNQSTVEEFIPYELLFWMLVLFMLGVYMAASSLKRLRHNEELHRKEILNLERQHEHDRKVVEELTNRVEELLSLDEDEAIPPP